MTEIGKPVEKNYIIAQNEQMQLRSDYCERLGWKGGETRCFVYADKKRGLLYFVGKDEDIAKLPIDRFVQAKPLIGRVFLITERRSISVARDVMTYLGWGIGDKISQELNLNINGIVCRKQEEISDEA